MWLSTFRHRQGNAFNKSKKCVLFGVSVVWYSCCHVCVQNKEEHKTYSGLHGTWTRKGQSSLENAPEGGVGKEEQPRGPGLLLLMLPTWELSEDHWHDDISCSKWCCALEVTALFKPTFTSYSCFWVLLHEDEKIVRVPLWRIQGRNSGQQFRYCVKRKGI